MLGHKHVCFREVQMLENLVPGKVVLKLAFLWNPLKKVVKISCRKSKNFKHSLWWSTAQIKAGISFYSILKVCLEKQPSSFSTISTFQAQIL